MKEGERVMKFITRLIVAALAVGVITTSFQPSVGASAQEGEWKKREVVEQRTNNNIHYSLQDLERFIANCFGKANISWGKEKAKKYYNNKYKHSYSKKYWNKNGKKEQVVPEEQETPNEESIPEQPNDNEESNNEQTENPINEEQNNNEQANENPTQEEVIEENNEEQNEEANEANGLNEFEQQVVQLTNVERSKHGLAPLQIDAELSKVAREKSRDMRANNYFDHTSPVYGSPFDMMRSFGISYTSAGENIAKGQRTPEEVVNAWMNSPGHRANIVNNSYTHIGVGYVQEGNYWTQMFIRK